jgi:translation initiation factor IF-3
MQKRPNQRTTNDRNPGVRINEQITGVTKVRLVTDDGSNIVTLEDALKQAQAEELDLVEVAGGQEVPVVKLIDYGKFKFEQLKKNKEAKKKQHVITIKEIKVRPRIDTNDFEIKKRHAIEFLQKGDKVKLTLRFKGREMMHSELGMNIINKFVEEIKEHGNPEKTPVHDGKTIIVVINPLKTI